MHPAYVNSRRPKCQWTPNLWTTARNNSNDNNYSSNNDKNANAHDIKANTIDKIAL